MEKTSVVPSNKKDIAVWSIDPFEAATCPKDHAVAKIESWARLSNLELQPTYVLPLPAHLSEGATGSAELTETIELARKAGDQYVSGSDSVRACKVLLSRSTSRKDQIAQMIEFADQQKSACFVVASNGRSGVQRFILGSFAESLLAHSKQPVLFLNQSNPDDVRDRTLNHALFATDFSDVSKIVFEHFLLQAQRSALEITLFHAVSLPMLAYAGGDVGPNMVPEDFFSTQMKWAADKGAEWLELAKKAGVPANFMLKYEGLAPEMAKVVLAAADEAKAGFIVMASKKTTATSFALGGFSREVFRSRSYPVWMYGPEAIRAIEIKGAN